jgi:hypothetical protein
MEFIIRAFLAVNSEVCDRADFFTYRGYLLVNRKDER